MTVELAASILAEMAKLRAEVADLRAIVEFYEDSENRKDRVHKLNRRYGGTNA